MPSIHSLIQTLSTAYPALTFTKGDTFRWSPSEQTVFFQLDHPHAEALLLHEAAHGILGHTRYESDVSLLSMEAAAWEKALQLANLYAVTIAHDTAEDHMDTYRDWLHARSTCPNCTATGYQTKADTYHCPACLNSWRVNEARSCQLRRYAA